MEPSYFKLSTDSCPTHLAVLDEVAAVHPTLQQQILFLLIRLFESKQDELEILVQLEMKKMILDRMVNLLTRGCVVPVLRYIKQCCAIEDTDISLIRYFVTEVLETITHPYSPEFVQLFLPMVENEEITGTMRGEGDNDPVSEFIGELWMLTQLSRSFLTLVNYIFQFTVRRTTRLYRRWQKNLFYRQFPCKMFNFQVFFFVIQTFVAPLFYPNTF